MKYRELLLGCGRDHRKQLALDGVQEWRGLVTLDFDATLNPDVVHNLDDLPYPFDDESFDEIHAYEVLEHCGMQGDWQFFFDQFAEFWRILKPKGLFYATVPKWDSVHAWGDPGHTRIISEASITFLRQEMYGQPNSPMTDYRFYWDKDFGVEVAKAMGERFVFCLRKQ